MIKISKIRNIELGFAFLILLSACSPGQDSAPSPRVTTNVVQVFVTATRPPPTRTPIPTSTPTPTPTPTATAISADLDEGYRSLLLRDPEPEPGAPCGVVDILDFPLDPPFALNAFGGRDYGTFRSRYDKYHAGEDWGLSGFGGNFGEPVYSIGHGVVTYAAPLGWGADQGVIIIRHTFTDGRTVLSFYGHVDPPSVLLSPGACVARGDKIAEIGRPRTPPHLHFEIRSHLPVSPGPGYWSVDPTLGGWLPPSIYIWANRIRASPGVEWYAESQANFISPIGSLTNQGFLTLQDSAIAAVDLEEGELIWTHPVGLGRLAFGRNAESVLIFIGDQFGNISANRVPDFIRPDLAEDESVLEPVWEFDLGGRGIPEILSLPGGGAAIVNEDAAFGLDREGEILWETEGIGEVVSWVESNEVLYFTTEGDIAGLWAADLTGIEKISDKTGELSISGADIFINDSGAIWQKEGGQPPRLVWQLSKARDAGGMVITGSGVLLLHDDLFDQRIISISAEGALNWEKSIRFLGSRDSRLFSQGGRPYLFTRAVSGSTHTVTIYAVDSNLGTLKPIFTGGTRDAGSASGFWVVPVGDRHLLISISGGGLVLLDPIEAETWIRSRE